MLLIELYITFLKIGFSSFGGMSAIALILEEMETHQWVSTADLTNLIGIAEMTPGPLGLNCATFAGIKTAGMVGGIVAVLGVLTPAYTLALAVAIFYNKFKTSTVMQWIMSVVKPITIAMIIDVLVSQVLKNYFLPASWIPDPRAFIIGGICFYLVHLKRWSVPKVVVLAAAMGILFYGLTGILFPYS